MIFIVDFISCSTCFGHHYAHHQELESIIQMVAACGIWCFGFQVVGMVWSWGLCVRFAGCCFTALLLHLVGILFPHINEDTRSEALQIHQFVYHWHKMKLNSTNEVYFHHVIRHVLLVHSFTNRWCCLFLYFWIFYLSIVASISFHLFWEFDL